MYICEYLPRLNTITIAVDFPYDINTITSIAPHPNELIITAIDSINIKLPILSQYAITNIRKTGESLFVSLKVAQTKSSTNFMVNDFQWSTKDLLKTPQNSNKQNVFQLQCIKCDDIIIDSVKWKVFDMPSELWTELMDLWHCHKPAGPATISEKNYNGPLTPKPRLIIMGSYYIVMNQQDTQQYRHNNELICSCGHELGLLSKIMKWNLKLVYDDVIETYPRYYYIYNLILDKINLNAARKLVIGKYLIWIFNIGLSTSFNGNKHNSVLKLCYIPWQEKPIDEEILADQKVLQEFYRELESNHQQLPKEAKYLHIKEDNEDRKYNISYLGLR